MTHDICHMETMCVACMCNLYILAYTYKYMFCVLIIICKTYMSKTNIIIWDTFKCNSLG